jgi:hypothetical protein
VCAGIFCTKNRGASKEATPSRSALFAARATGRSSALGKVPPNRRRPKARSHGMGVTSWTTKKNVVPPYVDRGLDHRGARLVQGA